MTAAAQRSVCHSGTQTPDHDAGHWTAEEIAWARECFRCGDAVAEIAATSGRDFLDVAMALEVYGFVSRDRRWQPSTPRSRPRFVGGLVKEVAAWRYARNDDAGYLARLAGVSLSTMHAALRGVRRLPTTQDGGGAHV